MAVKTVLFHIPQPLFTRFKVKLAADDLRQKEWGITVVEQYLDGQITVAKQKPKPKKS